MVTTRRGAHSTPAADDSSSGDTDIPAEPVRRRQQPTGKPATLRPSRDPAESHANPSKRKRPVHGPRTGGTHPPKRVKEEPAVKDSIEVQADDDEVDAVLNATTVRRSQIEIPLRTFRGRWADDGITPADDRSKPPTTHAQGPRLRAKRLNRHVRSVEVTGRLPDAEAMKKRTRSNAVRERVAETPEPESHQREDEEPPVAAASPAELLGSPELQSSALKRRRARPRDVYHFPPVESEPPSPAPHILPKTAVGVSMPVEPPKNTARARFQTVREFVGPPSNREKNHHPAGTVDEDEWPIQDGDGLEASDEVSESEDLPWEESDIEDEAGAGPAAGSQPNSVPIRIQPYIRSTQTISVPGHHLRNIFVIMGRRGWTGAGSRWGHELLRSARDPRRLARLGEEGIEALGRLRDLLDDTPNALDLLAQSQSLAKDEQALNEAVTDIDKLVARLERRAASARRAARGRMDPDRPGSLASDIYSFVIPMLVQVLRSCYDIGIQEPDAEVVSALADEAAFTGVSIQILLRIIWWLIRIQRLLEEHFTPAATDDEGPDISARRDPEDPEQNRVKACKLFKAWKTQVQLKVDAFNEKASRERNLYEKKKRDEEVRRAREREEEAKIAEARRLDEAWKRSIELATKKPRPNELLWREHWPVSSSLPQSSVNGSSSNPSRQVRPTATPRSTNPSRPPPPPLSISSSSSSSAFATPPRQQQPSAISRAAQAAPAAALPAPVQAPAPDPVRTASAVLDDSPWPEFDTEWLLEQMVAPDRTADDPYQWADALKRRVEEVVAEIERLKRVGRYRSPGPT